MPWDLVAAMVIGVRLTGQLSGWTSARHHLQTGWYSSLSLVVRARWWWGSLALALTRWVQLSWLLICNMPAEVGSTSCIFHIQKPYDIILMQRTASMYRRQLSESRRLF